MLGGVLERADGAITTGGLGPTVDDLTKDAVAKAVERRRCELHEPSMRAMRGALPRPQPADDARTTAAKRSCRRARIVMPNPHGTAPGFIALRPTASSSPACRACRARCGRCWPISSSRGWSQRFGLHSAIYTKTLHTIGIGESELDRRVEDLFRSLENPKIAMLAHGGRVDVKVMAKAASAGRSRRDDRAGRRSNCANGSARATSGTMTRRSAARSCASWCARGRTLGDGRVGHRRRDRRTRSSRSPAPRRPFVGGVVAYDNAVKQSAARRAGRDAGARTAPSAKKRRSRWPAACAQRFAATSRSRRPASPDPTAARRETGRSGVVRAWPTKPARSEPSASPFPVNGPIFEIERLPRR